MARHWGTGEYAAFKKQDQLDACAGRIRETEQAKQRQEQFMAKTWQTSFGERVERFPKVDDLRERIGAVREALAEAFDAAEEQRARAARMANTNKADAGRFPSIQGGDR